MIPALIRKMHEAKISSEKEVLVWGSGMPRREFLYSDDLADACRFLMDLNREAFDCLVASETNAPLINIGAGEDLTIRELAELIAAVVGFDGVLRFDPTKPDGTPRKLLDVSRLNSLGWKPRTALREGLELAYRDFLESFAAQAETEHSLSSPASVLR